MTDMQHINNNIKKYICHNTINKLKDINLLNEYKETKSLKNSINILTDILKKHNIEDDKTNMVINDYLLHLVPTGTKGVIRGNKFNQIVKEEILKIDLNEKDFEVMFEKMSETYDLPEIPDWYILEKSTKKIIFGMNQIDLWSGGHQRNRGSKYIIDNKFNTENSKLLCVICNNITFKKDTNKIYNLFKIGFDNDTLCYLKNLNNIILKYFIKLSD